MVVYKNITQMSDDEIWDCYRQKERHLIKLIKIHDRTRPRVPQLTDDIVRAENDLTRFECNLSMLGRSIPAGDGFWSREA